MYHKLQRNLKQTVSQGELVETALPLCPAIKLYLLSADYPRGRLDQDEMMAIINTPAYWSFCWASGQVLATYILDHPAMFRGKRILDFGAGSGVVAIAAKIAGADKVIACDIDVHALAACAANAFINGVDIEYLDDVNALASEIDLIIAADVLYDRDNYPWIDKLSSIAPQVLIADSRVKSDILPGFEIIDRVTATTIPDLDELKEYNDVRIYLSKEK